MKGTYQRPEPDHETSPQQSHLTLSTHKSTKFRVKNLEDVRINIIKLSCSWIETKFTVRKTFPHWRWFLLSHHFTCASIAGYDLATFETRKNKNSLPIKTCSTYSRVSKCLQLCINYLKWQNFIYTHYSSWESSVDFVLRVKTFYWLRCCNSKSMKPNENMNGQAN